MTDRTCAPPGPETRQDEPREEASRCLATLLCDYCDICILMCPDLCIIRDDKSGKILIDLDFCKGCGLCAIFCPHDAIQMVIDEQA